VFALLPNKRRETYEELFDVVLNKINGLQLPLEVEHIMTDIEDTVLRAIQGVFDGGVQQHGCFYHLTQSTWRKIQELGLTNLYREDDNFKLFVGMLDGLAFLPLNQVPAGMHLLRNIAPDEAEDLVNYFDTTYVSGRYRQRLDNGHINIRRAPALFPPELWNQHESTLNGDPRTNNICESWNHRFQHLVGYYHPDIWRCVEWFRLEEASDATTIAQNAVGNMPRRRVRREFVLMQQHLQNLCNDFIHGRKNMEEFLRGVGRNVRLENRYA